MWNAVVERARIFAALYTYILVSKYNPFFRNNQLTCLYFKAKLPIDDYILFSYLAEKCNLLQKAFINFWLHNFDFTQVSMYV